MHVAVVDHRASEIFPCPILSSLSLCHYKTKQKKDENERSEL